MHVKCLKPFLTLTLTFLMLTSILCLKASSNEELPDLAIINFYWQPENPTLNTPISFYIIVENIGKGAVTNPFNVELNIRDMKVRWHFSYSELPINPGDQWTFPTEPIKLASGTYPITVKVDPEKYVPDANRENNEIKKTLIVSAQTFISESTATTIIKTTATLRFSTILKTATATTFIASITELNFPEKVDLKETFKVSGVINYEFPKGAKIRVEVVELNSGKVLASMDSDFVSAIGKCYFEFWLTAPNNNTIWNLRVIIYYSTPGKAFYYIDSKDFSIVVGQALTKTISISTYTSFTSVLTTESPLITTFTPALTTTFSSITTGLIETKQLWLASIIAAIGSVVIAVIVLLKGKSKKAFLSKS